MPVLLTSMSRTSWKSSRKSGRAQMLCRLSMSSRWEHGCEHRVSRELLHRTHVMVKQCQLGPVISAPWLQATRMSEAVDG